MGYLSIFNIGATVDSNCSYLEITDNNSYPITLDGSPRSRSDLGIAVFWSLDGFSSVTGSNLTNNTTWSIPSPISGVYSIRTYVVPIWAAGSWAINSIVYDNGYFYYTAAGTSDVPNPNVDNGWAKLSGSDHATFVSYLYSASVINYGYTSLSQETTCTPYTISKTGAGTYTITYASSSNDKTLTITYYNGDALTTPYSETLSIGTTSFDVDISVEGDATFVFKFEETGVETYQYVVYEISALEACRNSMTQNILQLCDDGCLDDCFNTNQAEEVSLRHELNKLILLYSAVLSKINVESLSYLGIYTIDDTRQAYINEIGDLIEKINSIVESCGNCS